MNDRLRHRTSPAAALAALALLGAPSFVACSGGEAPVPAPGGSAPRGGDAVPRAASGAPPDVLERPTAYPPALRDVVARLDPARDRWECEVLATRATEALDRLAQRLERDDSPAAAWCADLAAPAFESALGPLEDGQEVRAGALAVRRYSPEATAPTRRGPDGLADVLDRLLARFDRARGVRLTFELDRTDATASDEFTTSGPVQLLGRTPGGALLQQNARWDLAWSATGEGPRLVGLEARELEEVEGPASGAPLFEDCTRSAIGRIPGYEELVLLGVPHWNASLDKALDTAVFGHNGLAVGDADGDGLEDLYVCQAGGLPNQLLVRAPDGTASDRAAELGVDVLDFTRSALFVDLDDDGDQDLLLATSKALVLFEGRPGAPFRLALSMPITGTALAAADADGDGRLDVYVCRYSRPESLWPVPYHDASNGPSNVLLRNAGGLRFELATEELGLDAANTRYSFAAGWLDYDGDADQDLYVANDFGRNVLYVNEGGRFREAASGTAAEDMAAGMSVSWGDYDADGAPDLYVANMFSPAGSRLAHQAGFRGDATAEHYRRHARGNTLLHNRGDGTFEDVSVEAGVALGRWAWGSAFVDVDDDGRLDLAVANGYLTNDKPDLLCSFFWRQVVGLSPDGPDEVVPAYEDGWAALSDLQREYSFNADERNCLFLNTGTPRFADASGVSGIDFPDDGRALAFVDWDGDGALDLWISSRSAPRLRLLRNTRASGGRSLLLRLEDRAPNRDAPNRDAIGARVELAGRGSRWVVAGDGFLSQSTRWLHFGLGAEPEAELEALVTWPDGTRETFAGLAPGRFRLVRGTGRGTPVEPPGASRLAAEEQVVPDQAPRAIVRLAARLPVLALEAAGTGAERVPLAPGDGRRACVVLWDEASPASLDALAGLARDARLLEGVRVLALGVAPPERRRAAADALAGALGGVDAPFDVAFASDELVGTLELLLRGVFEQPPPLLLPSALVIDAEGALCALSRGRADARELAGLLDELPPGLDDEARRARATPFRGTWLSPPATRSMQALAAVLRRHERLELAAAYLGLALPGGGADLEGDAAARLADSQELLGRELASNQQWQEAAEAFEACLELDPSRARVHVELGNACRGLERPADALRHYQQALELDPRSADAHYSVGLMQALAGEFPAAQRSFEAAVRNDPERPLAHYNLGVSLANQGRFDDAARAIARALELDPDYLPATQTLATVHARRNDAPAAVRVFRAGLERHPGHPQLLYGLGRACLAAGDGAGADDALARLRAADPNLAARLEAEVRAPR